MIVNMYTTGRRLVPLAEYTKPLAKTDQYTAKSIAKVEGLIANLEDDLSSYQRELGIPGNISSRVRTLKVRIDKTIQKINSLRDYVRSLKVESYRNQLYNP